MSNKHDQTSSNAKLRQATDEHDKRKAPLISDVIEGLSPTEIQQRLHQLQVYQIELELQNEQLRKTQEDLKRLKKRYFDLYNLAPVGYCTIDENGLILEANLFASKLFRLHRKALVGQKISRFIFIEDQDKYYLFCRKLLFENPEVETCELRIDQGGEEVLWVHLSVTQGQDENGLNINRVVINDITKSKQLGEKYLSLIENLGDCIWATDSHGHFTHLSPGFQNLTEYPPSEFLNKTPEDLMSDDQCQQIREIVIDMKTAPQPFSALELQFKHQDGQMITAETSGVPVFNSTGEFQGFWGITRDVTERKLMEKQLHRSMEQYQTLFNGAADAIFIFDMETNIISVNEMACKQYGYNMEEFLTLKVWNIDAESETLQISARLSELVRDKEIKFETIHRDATENTFPVEVKATIIPFNGEICCMAICRDISQHKHNEDNLQVINRELDLRVQERTMELSDTNVALTVLLKKREKDQDILAKQMLLNVNELVDPFLERLKNHKLTERQRLLVDVIQTNIKELTSPFTSKYSSKMIQLTPTEIQVANLVKQGKPSKEIAEIMELSPGTVNIHRKNIRKKLNISHQNINLQTVLSISS